MMTANESSLDLISVATLDLPPMLLYPVFIIGLIIFVVTIICNMFLIVSIAFSKHLHKPMFLLLVNLYISDTISTLAFFPAFLIGIVMQKRIISYSECMTQAFFIHFYATANMFTLSAMAYDRCIAVCAPLRYSAIMTPHKVMKLIFSIWFVDFALIFSVFMLLVRFRICRNKIWDLYCNNPSIMKLICGNTIVNNYFGLATLVIGQGGSLLVVIYTYSQILWACLKTNREDTWQKAFQTCSTHLVTFLVIQNITTVSLIAHRFRNVSALLTKILGLPIIIFPPLVDPIIYGLKVKDLRLNISRFLKRRCLKT